MTTDPVTKKLWESILNESMYGYRGTLQQWREERQKEWDTLKESWKLIREGHARGEDCQRAISDLGRRLETLEATLEDTKSLLDAVSNIFSR